MKLDDAQKQRVAAWIQEGLKLSEIQNRIGSEFGLRLTYMDVRFLVDDLKLTPKDAETPKTPTLNAPSGVASQKSPTAQTVATSEPAAPAEPQPAPIGSSVSVSIDQLTKPGAMVSGKVTFSDGNKADWYFDQMGRLGLAPQQPGYRPPQSDLQQFQAALEAELSKMGY
jgi:hypothetical protein